MVTSAGGSFCRCLVEVCMGDTRLSLCRVGLEIHRLNTYPTKGVARNCRCLHLIQEL